MLKSLPALRQGPQLLHPLVLLRRALAVPARAMPGRLPQVFAPLLSPSRWLVLGSAGGPGALTQLGRLTLCTLLRQEAKWFPAKIVPLIAIP